MANLKNIKNRISSVKNTQKITKAMKMVAASKVKKAESAVKMSRPFTFELFDILSHVQKELKTFEFEPIKTKRPLDNYVELLSSREIKTVGILLISSNQGLAGAYSTNLVKFAQNKIENLKKEGKNVILYLAGQKVLTAMKNLKRTLDFEIKEVYTNVISNLNPVTALVLSEDIARDWVNGTLDEVQLVLTRYQNMMTYKVEDWTLLPLNKANDDLDLKKFHTEEKNGNGYHAQMIFEPDARTILSKIIPMYVTNVIYQALLESRASEMASRMSAMSLATSNAQEMIENLTVSYNKARQEKITQELTEIVSGANAIG